MERNIIGARIEHLRKESGQTQKEVADAIGVKRETVNQWESGTRDLKTGAIIALAKHFHVTSDYILGLSVAKTTDTDLKAVCDYTGLSEDAVNKLTDRIENDDFLFLVTINYLITSELASRLRDYLLSDTLRDYVTSKYEKAFPFSGNVVAPYQNDHLKESLIDSEQTIYFAGIIQDISYYKDELYGRIKNDAALKEKVLLAQAADTFAFFNAKHEIAEKEKCVMGLQTDLDQLLSQKEIDEHDEFEIEKLTLALNRWKKSLERLKNAKAEIENGLHNKR